jgi:hypothetical protein
MAELNGGHVLMVVSWPEREDSHPLSKPCVWPGLVLFLAVESGANPNLNDSSNTVVLRPGINMIRIPFSFLLWRSAIFIDWMVNIFVP